ncbi:unnamed protein product [Caenorhabditis angaria]|uniref:Uncharacterized protein n=1 Tax=Caenorhabditis angaria TaxID=860376 RepID=A0A9P1MZS2_9PELO|nr:unnamed protein product [Caenorhabditis angaria]
MQTETKNTLLVSTSFFLLFYAVLSVESILHPMIESYSRTGKYNIESTDAFTGLSIVFTVSAITSFIVSPLVDILTPKWAMVIGMSTNWLAQFQVFYLNRYFMFIVMTLLGIGTNLCWIGQGKYITNNCTDRNITKNTSLQWGFYKISLILAGITSLLYFWNTDVDKEVKSGRINYYLYFMLGVTTLAIVNTAFLPTSNIVENKKKYRELLKEIDKQMRTRRTLLLSTIYLLLGVSRAFWSVIFPSIVKFSRNMGGNTSRYLGMSVIATGVGQVFGAFLITWLGVRARKIGRNNIVISTMLAQIIVLVLICISFPNDAIKNHSFGNGLLITPNIYVTLFCSTLLGFADAVLNTQVYSYIADFYKEESSSAFSIFRYFCAITTMIIFIVAKYFNLYVIVGIYGIMSIISMVSAHFIKPDASQSVVPA